MMEPNFHQEFEIRPLEYRGPESFVISEPEIPNMDVLQEELVWKLESGWKKLDDHLHSHGISIDEAAIHERIEKIMGLDEESLNILEKSVKAKLEEKRKELDKQIKSL
ncbi:hypothetical protein KKA03_02525 [archaeon]|nr:hypothetical protein [archaeon]